MQGPSTRIYLTGFMGTGKSTVGPHIARLLGRRFVDLDRLIEAETGLPIPALFRLRGEAAFREMERQAVDRIVGMEGVVVSLGGGAITRADLRQKLLASGTLVCLTVPFDVLVERLSRHPERRPLLHSAEGRALTGPSLVARIEELLAERADAYASAHVTIEGGTRSALETAQRVVDAIAGGPG